MPGFAGKPLLPSAVAAGSMQDLQNLVPQPLQLPPSAMAKLQPAQAEGGGLHWACSCTCSGSNAARPVGLLLSALKAICCEPCALGLLLADLTLLIAAPTAEDSRVQGYVVWRAEPMPACCSTVVVLRTDANPCPLLVTWGNVNVAGRMIR